MNRRKFIRYGALTVGAGLLASYPIFIERYIVQVNTYNIKIPRLPTQFEGFTIIQLTDLHYGSLVPYVLLKNVVKKVNTIPRDIIICTGDYIHERKSVNQLDTIWPLLGNLTAPLGVYSVLGNHDHWADTERSIYWLQKTGQCLRHRVKKITKNGASLWIAGAGDLWEDHKKIDTILNPIPKDHCTILLAHNPDSADTILEAKPDLIIAGHTHGGQVNIPFYGTPVLPVKNKAYSFGLKKSQKGLSVFISRGIGWAIYPVRFNCFPEIAVLKLTCIV